MLYQVLETTSVQFSGLYAGFLFVIELILKCSCWFIPDLMLHPEPVYLPSSRVQTKPEEAVFSFKSGLKTFLFAATFNEIKFRTVYSSLFLFNFLKIQF